MKGCGLHCPWCSNPENIPFYPQNYSLDGKSGVYGKAYEPEELVDELLKDRVFWGDNGGITFSGGEALLQIDKLEKVLSVLRDKGINLAIETSLFAEKACVAKAIETIDYFIVDVKILDPDICRSILGGDVRQYMDNMDLLYSSGRKILFRVPCNHEYTMDDFNVNLLVSFFQKYSGVPIQIFAIHNLASEKYRSLQLEMWRHQEVRDDQIVDLACLFSREGIDTEVVRI